MTDNNTPDEQPEGDPVADAEAVLSGAAAAMAWEGSPVEADEAGADDALARAEAAAAEHLEDLKRLQAEYVNYRKRVDRDREQMGTLGQARVIEALLPALDDIHAARDHGDLDGGPFAAIADKLEASLAKFGWESFGAEGDPFDPALHEALATTEDPNVTEPTVAKVAQPGHKVGDRVVRPARVIVSQPQS